MNHHVMHYQPVSQWLIPFLKKIYPHLYISDVWPEAENVPPDTWIVIRDDGMTRLTMVTRLQAFGVTVCAPTQQKADELALTILDHIDLTPGMASTPVAAINSVYGPTPINDPVYENLRTTNYHLIITGVPTSIELEI